MVTGRIPFAGPPIGDPYRRTLWELMQRRIDTDAQFNAEERERSQAKYATLANIPIALHEQYLGAKERQRYEDDRERNIARQKRLDDIAAEERAQAARTLASQVGRQRVSYLTGQDEAVIAASLGDLLTTKLPSITPPGAPLYLPDLPLTDPERDVRADPRQLPPSQSMPMGEPLVHLATVPSEIEGDPDYQVPITTKQQQERVNYKANQQKIIDLDLSDARRLSFNEENRAAILRFEELNPKVELGNITRTDESGQTWHVFFDKKTGEEQFTLEGSVQQEDAPSQTSMFAQAEFGLNRVLSGKDPGEFSYQFIRSRVADPRHFEAKIDSYRDSDSSLYKRYLVNALADNPEMIELQRDVEHRMSLGKPTDKTKKLDAFLAQVRQTYLDGIERYISIEDGQDTSGSVDQTRAQLLQTKFYVIDPETHTMVGIPDYLTTGMNSGEELELADGRVVRVWEHGTTAMGPETTR